MREYMYLGREFGSYHGHECGQDDCFFGGISYVCMRVCVRPRARIHVCALEAAAVVKPELTCHSACCTSLPRLWA